jgi:coenzyme PQQ precursor peptide PqqA
MQTWEKPSITVISLGAEVTAYLGSDTDATPV